MSLLPFGLSHCLCPPSLPPSASPWLELPLATEFHRQQHQERERIGDALHSFYEGPPFTLQRLCEILLDARGIYPNLSKLALALEKNLLVTSMLTMSTDPYPNLTIEKRNEPHEANEEPKSLAGSVQNGGEANKADDRDEIMTEVEEVDINDNMMTLDMEACEDIVGSSENNKVPTTNSEA